MVKRFLKYTSLFLITLIAITACDEEGGLLIEPDISNRTVTLIAPSNGAQIAATTLFFDWEAVEDATTYEIQVASPDFTNPGQLLLNVTDSLTYNELQLTVGAYEWRVRAKNSNYQTEYTTAAFTVIPIENFSENTVILLSPEDNLITNTATQNLQWQSIEGATLYRIQLIENGSVIQEETTTNTNFEIAFPEGEFTWQVRAENGIENTLYTAQTILVDTTNPNTPVLTAPTDGVELTSGQVNFEWTRDPIAGSTEVDSVFVFEDINLTNLVLKEQATSPYNTTLTNNTYYWYVTAFDEAGNQSSDSTVFSFTVNE